MDLFVSRWRKAANINTPSMTSSLKGNDVGTFFIDNCRILRTREPYLLSHCLWLDDKGIELIQTNAQSQNNKE